MTTPTYRLHFGQYKGKTLQEVEPRYRDWILKHKVYVDKPTLKAALIAGNYLAPDTNPYTPPSTPTPVTPSRKRQAPYDSEIAGSPSSRRKMEISARARRNDTMLNYDGSAYILDFGKHSGLRLSYVNEVDPTYIPWVIQEGIPEKRSDLKSALLEHGFIAADDTPPSSQEPPRWRAPSSQEPPPWRAPSIHETTDGRFFDHHRHTPAWISDADASLYFGLKEPLLSRRGVNLVTEEDVKRNAQYSELVSVSKGPKRWLYQVYSCAAEFGSVPMGRGTVEEALGDFLRKNKRREEEIRDAMGF